MLLLGGFTERDVSLLSGKEVKDALIRLGHEVYEFDIKTQDLCLAPLEKI